MRELFGIRCWVYNNIKKRFPPERSSINIFDVNRSQRSFLFTSKSFRKSRPSAHAILLCRFLPHEWNIFIFINGGAAWRQGEANFQRTKTVQRKSKWHGIIKTTPLMLIFWVDSRWRILIGNPISLLVMRPTHKVLILFFRWWQKKLSFVLNR